jgi:uncharacterized damage-inducible protein DinB
MDILDTYLAYEAQTLRYFLGRCRELNPEQWHQPFDIGQGSMYDTVGHIIRNLEFWTDLMRGVPDTKRPPVPDDPITCLPRFDSAMTYFTEYAKSVASDNRLDDIYLDTREDPPEPFRFGVTFLHVLVHTTGHRWEIQHMLQRLGVESEMDGDVQQWDWLSRLNNK